jgi:Flp pilus assembly protein TadG
MRLAAIGSAAMKLRLSDDRGTSLVEFALSASVLFMSLFGVFALCGALYSYVFIAEAAREASRYAIVRGSSCTGFSDCSIDSAGLSAYVRNMSFPGMSKGSLSAAADWPSGHGRGNPVSVTVSYSLPLVIPFWPSSGRTLQLSSTSQMIISQ